MDGTQFKRTSAVCDLPDGYLSAGQACVTAARARRAARRRRTERLIFLSLQHMRVVGTCDLEQRPVLFRLGVGEGVSHPIGPRVFREGAAPRAPRKRCTGSRTRSRLLQLPRAPTDQEGLIRHPPLCITTGGPPLSGPRPLSGPWLAMRVPSDGMRVSSAWRRRRKWRACLADTSASARAVGALRRG